MVNLHANKCRQKEKNTNCSVYNKVNLIAAVVFDQRRDVDLFSTSLPPSFFTFLNDLPAIISASPAYLYMRLKALFSVCATVVKKIKTIKDNLTKRKHGHSVLLHCF